MNGNKTYLLGIDTSGKNETRLTLSSSSGATGETLVSAGRAQTVVPAIEEILRKQELSLDALDSISVKTTSGSFTGLRVGVAVAKVLGFLLAIPVNGKKAQEPIGISYENDKFS